MADHREKYFSALQNEALMHALVTHFELLSLLVILSISAKMWLAEHLGWQAKVTSFFAFGMTVSAAYRITFSHPRLDLGFISVDIAHCLVFGFLVSLYFTFREPRQK